MRSNGNSGFIFVNNYERLQTLSAKRNVTLTACGVALPRLTVPSGAMAIFPVNIDGIKFATAQLVAKRNGNIYMMQVKGIPTTIRTQDGKTLKNVRPRGAEKPVYKNIYLLTPQEAEHWGLSPTLSGKPEERASWTKVREPGALRTVKKGRAKVAEAPAESDWEQAAVYKIAITKGDADSTKCLLSIKYQGDCARLYANGKLIADNFQYGRPFLYGLWRLPKDCNELELRILPLQPEAPVYLPREADRTAGEALHSVTYTPVEL